MVLRVKLVEYVLQSLEPFNVNMSTSAWSDSTVALAWIQSTPSIFQIFKANRIAKVQRAFPVENWKYVPTSENSADYCTRPVPIIFCHWISGGMDPIGAMKNQSHYQNNLKF